MPTQPQISIKIGQQEQANKPIYLHANGSLSCGNFQYKGRYKDRFKRYYREVLELEDNRPRNGILDVSNAAYWDALWIYEHYMVEKWQASVSAGRMRKLAAETKISLIILEIQPEFKRALGLRWHSVFMNMDSNDPNRPRQAWQII